MPDPSKDHPLPRPVEKLLRLICKEQSQPPPDTEARRELASLGEEKSTRILEKICRTKITKSFTGFIIYMAKQSRASATAADLGGDNKNVSYVGSPSSSSHSSSSSLGSVVSNEDNGSVISFISDKFASMRMNWFCSTKEYRPSPQVLTLEKLEFRRAFLLLSYLGGRKLEDVASIHDVRSLVNESNKLSMGSFEKHVWGRYGERYCSVKDRMRYHIWDSAGQHYFYHCQVYMDGSYAFKGPFLSMKTTLVHKILKDENVLIVKFGDEETRTTSDNVASGTFFAALERVAKEGIYFGKRCYRFFAYKDGGKGEKKKDPASGGVKCYFINVDAFADSFGFDKKCLRQARSTFLHLDTLPSIFKYTARLELVLSKTFTLPVNLEDGDVHVQVIDDIPCEFADGSIVTDENGQALIHTDGTGFISEDLARMCPPSFFKVKLLNDHNFERSVSCDLELNELASQSSEPPLLTQFRLFYEGYAVKGTVLVNRMLDRRTIQVRPSMIKVFKDTECPDSVTVNSFEVVAASDRPKRTYLSKYLIALLHYGGVPREFFTDILKDTLAEAQTSLTSKRVALQVALATGEMDDEYLIARMILAGIPLEEPYIRLRLPFLANQQKKTLKEGKLPIDESFYLMGTSDPTRSLKSDEVCIIHENGQISGKVLVYRNPGIHFGDVHVLTAKPIEGLEEIVGNSKYGIFFPTIGPRSLADKMAGGDFDGDLYWVSRNSELLRHFQQSEPWTCTNHSSSANSRQEKPINFSDEELERELFTRFLTARFQPSKVTGIASNSWLVHMDRMLSLGDTHTKERTVLKEKMLKLVDIYYEALDAPKTGVEVKVPRELIPDAYPHYMETTKDSYKSLSVLGEIYDLAHEWTLNSPAISVRKLLSFDLEIPNQNFKKWKHHYKLYRAEMTDALSKDDKVATAKIILKYKQILYEASELENSPRPWDEIRVDAVAIYHVCYDYAMEIEDVRKCGFAWKVAGASLIRIFIEGHDEKPLACSTSVLKELVTRR